MITPNIFLHRHRLLIKVFTITGLSIFFTVVVLCFPAFQTGVKGQSVNFVVNFKNDGGCTTSGLPDHLPTSGTPTNWPEEAKAAFLEAVSIWDTLLRPQQTIEINACFVNLGPEYSDLLGMAQPVSAYADFAGAPITHTWYPVALANQLAGSDLNNADGTDHDGDDYDDDAEIIVVINSDIHWYYGLDGSPGTDQYDFLTTALHEVGHGLGFVSTLFVDTGDDLCGTLGDGCWGIEDTSDSVIKPAVYDIFVENGSGQLLIDTGIFTNPSEVLANQLESGNLFFNGPQAKAVNNNQPPKLYAPDPFEPPSSILHLDYDTYHGTPDRLMTPIIDIGSAQHYPGRIALGMLADLGWNVAPPITITQQASSASVTAGELLTYTLAVTNTGSELATGIVITDVVPEHTSLVAGSLVGSEAIFSGTAPGNVITWITGISLSLDEMLTRTFTVLVDSALAVSTTITNTAYVSSTAEVEANTSLVVAAVPAVNPPVDPPVITITQQASSASVTAGELLTYTLAVTNTGSELATGIVITDVVPEHTSLVAGSLAGSEAIFSGTAPGNVITWATGISLSLDEMLTRTFTVLVDAGLTMSSTFTNTAYVSSTAGMKANSSLVVAAVPFFSITDDVYVYLPLILQ